MRTLLTTLAISVCVAALAAPAGASPVTAPIYDITDGNSTAHIDATANGFGMSQWKVDGTNQLKRQSFCYRIGSTGPEIPLNALPLTASGVSDTDFNGYNETLFLRYAGTGFTVEVMLVLGGGTAGSGTSDLAESIRISAAGNNEPLDFHFFQYCDLDLMGSVTDSSVAIQGANTAVQRDGRVWVSETAAVPYPSHFQAGIGSTLVDSLEDGSPTTLGDVAGPLGEGDLNWAFQWDFTLTPSETGSTYLISKDKHVTPEPASMTVLAIGALALLRRRRVA